MPNFTANTTIQAGGEKLSASASGDYGEVFRMTLSSPFGTSTTGTFQEAIQTHSITSAGYAKDLKYLLIKNIGKSAIELHFTIEAWTDAAPDAHTADAERFLRFLIPVGDYMLLPNIRLVDYGTEGTGAGAGVMTAAGITPDPNLYEALNNTASGDAQLIAEALDGTETGIDVDDTSYLYPGDLIQVGTEVIRVDQISSATSFIGVRGAYGSSAASHSDDTAIRVPFFNAYHKYGDTSINGGGDGSAAKCKTDVNGRFKCFNFFGFGRDANYEADGITPGSVSIQFRTEGGYQELGLSGITSSTNSGLSASTNYAFDIQVDGGTNFDNLTFTTDSSNLNFGGANGIIPKIQAALDTQYYTAGNLFQRGVDVGIVNGDIRFTSRTNHSASAIALTAEDGADASFFGTGRVPAVGAIEPAVAKEFASRYVNKANVAPIIGSESSIKSAIKGVAGMCTDNGKGNLIGAATGTINYGSGALDFTALPNADFKVWMSYGSALSGNVKTETTNCNAIKEFRFRGTNWNVDATIEFIGMN